MGVSVGRHWLVIFLGLMSLLFGTISIVFYQRTLSLLAGGTNTTGSVIRLEYTSSVGNSNSGSYYPVIRFKTESGEEMKLRSHYRCPPPEYRVGDTVKIIYNKDNPKDWSIEGWMDFYFLPSMFGAASAALAIANAIVITYKAFKPKVESTQ